MVCHGLSEPRLPHLRLHFDFKIGPRNLEPHPALKLFVRLVLVLYPGFVFDQLFGLEIDIYGSFHPEGM